MSREAVLRVVRAQRPHATPTVDGKRQSWPIWPTRARRGTHLDLSQIVTGRQGQLISFVYWRSAPALQRGSGSHSGSSVQQDPLSSPGRRDRWRDLPHRGLTARVARTSLIGAFPLGIDETGATPQGVWRRCKSRNTPAPAPGRKKGGSLPSTSDFPVRARRSREYGRNCMSDKEIGEIECVSQKASAM